MRGDRALLTSPGILDRSTCTNGYTATLAYTCTKCLKGSKQIALTVVVGAIAFTVFLILIFYMVSTVEAESAEEAGICSVSIALMKRVFFGQALKTVIVSWQILTQASGNGCVVMHQNHPLLRRLKNIPISRCR